MKISVPPWAIGWMRYAVSIIRCSWNRIMREARNTRLSGTSWPGEYDTGEYIRIGKGGVEVSLQASYTPVQDILGHVYKVVKVAAVTTEAALQAAVQEEKWRRCHGAGDDRVHAGWQNPDRQ
jgi:hypothetical protein